MNQFIHTGRQATNRALFAKKETAEDACRNPRNPNMEPFCITGDPIRAAGGCYCRECKRSTGGALGGYLWCGKKVVEPNGWCKWSEPREAKDDG